MFSLTDHPTMLPGAESKANGSFQSAPLFPGDYRVYVMRPPYLNEVVSMDGLLGQESRDLGVIRLRDACSASVLCRSSQARELRIRVETPQGEWVASDDLSAGPDARPTRLERLPATELRILLLEKDQEVTRQSFTPLVGQANTVEISLPPRDR